MIANTIEEDFDCLPPDGAVVQPYEDDEARVFHEKGIFMHDSNCVCVCARACVHLVYLMLFNYAQNLYARQGGIQTLLLNLMNHLIYCVKIFLKSIMFSEKFQIVSIVELYGSLVKVIVFAAEKAR